MNPRDTTLFIVYLIYGSSFLFMAGAIWVHRERTAKLGVARSMGLLALFALTHGVADLLGAAMQTPWGPRTFEAFSGAMYALFLILSFLVLLQFGMSMLLERPIPSRYIVGTGALTAFALVIAVAQLAEPSAADVTGKAEGLARVLLGLPGGLLSAMGLLRLARRCDEHGLRGCGTDSRLLAAAMAVYALLTGYPGSVSILGLPIQFFRMLLAVALTVASVRLLRRFNVRT